MVAARSPDRYTARMSDRYVVVGGGLLGCATALELARRGARVTVLERVVPGAEASSAAGGILAPRMEAHGNAGLRALGLESLAMYPGWVASLAADVDLRWDGLARVVFPGEDPAAACPDRDAHWRDDLPGLALPGWELPGEGSLDPRKLVAAVHAAVVAAGVDVRGGAEVVEVGPTRVRLADGSTHEGRTIVCAGAWTARVPGLEGLPVRPVRGQMVVVKGEVAPPSVVFASGGYLVPRPDGRVLVGSTMEEVGYTRGVTVAGVQHLLALATRLLPGLREAALLETWSGFRPGTPDGLPYLGEIGGVYVASGHFRNGILLAPLTARWVADALLRGEPVPAEVRIDR